MVYPHSVIEEVRLNNDIVEVIGESVQLKPQSGGYVGLCPFHHEKTPSFHVNSRDQYFYCFGCGEKGDVISFVMKSRGYAFTDAVKYLAGRINYPLPEAEYSADYKKTAEERAALYEMNKKAARYYYDCLMGSDGFLARQYLDNRRIRLKTRGVYGLGFSPFRGGGVKELLEKEGYSRELMLKSGLVTEGKNGRFYDKFFNRLMFPIIDIHGRIVGFGGRVLDDGQPKYLNSPDTPVFNKSSNLYSMNLAIKERKRELILVEGYMDVITLYQAGFKTAVAALGTSFNANHTKLLRKYADSVILLFDSDEAGVKAVLRAIPVLKEAGIVTKVLQVTGAKDPDEYIKKFGRESFSDLLATALPQAEFRLKLEKQGKNLESPEDKLSYVKAGCDVLKTLDSDVEKDIYIKKLSEETGVEAASIKAELERGNLPETVPERKKALKKAAPNEKTGLQRAKQGIINIISYNPYIYDKLNEVFKGEYLCDPFLERLFGIINENVSKGAAVCPAEVINYFENPIERNEVMEILTFRREFEDKRVLEKNLNDYLKTILNAYYSEQIGKEQDINKVKELIEKKRKLSAVFLSLK